MGLAFQGFYERDRGTGKVTGLTIPGPRERSRPSYAFEHEHDDEQEHD